MNRAHIEVLTQVLYGTRDNVFFSDLGTRRVHFISSRGCRSHTQEEFAAKRQAVLDRTVRVIDGFLENPDDERFFERMRDVLNGATA